MTARALAKTREERFATARDFAVALQSAIRRAEDQTVLPPLNPNKGTETGSRPLTSPGVGTVPPVGTSTSPSIGMSSVSQEIELVYWKDVKDASDPEELQGFLEKFPAGIYADLARRRLRKLMGADPSTVMGGASQPGIPSRPGSLPAATVYPAAGSTFATLFPDNEATRLRTDTSRPAVPADLSRPRPQQWIDEEYTGTVAEGATSQPAPPQPAAAQPAPSLPGVRKAATLSGAAAAASLAAPAAAVTPPPV